MTLPAPDLSDELRPEHLDPATFAFYRGCMKALNEARCEYLVGGAYAFARYTAIERHTKDFDIFCRQRDVDPILSVLERLGCQTDRAFPHWLAKAYNPGTADFIDVIYSSGSGIAVVDDEWFTHSVPETVLGIPVRLCPAEEIIWSKGFIMERERYDGNDVAHLLRARGKDLDWSRVLRRFGPHWRVLLSHLVLFGFVYPAERDAIPAAVVQELLGRLEREAAETSGAEPVCHGTLLSNAQYLVDLRHLGYRDARLAPEGPLTPQQVAGALATIGGADRRVRLRRRTSHRRRVKRRA